MKKSLNPSNLGLLEIASLLTRRNMPAQQEVESIGVEDMPFIPQDEESVYLGEPVDVSMNREPQGTPQEDQLAEIARTYGVAESPKLDRGEYRKRLTESLTGTDPSAFAVNGKMGNTELGKYHTALAVDSQNRGIKQFSDVIQNNPYLWFDVIQPEIMKSVTPTDGMDPGWPRAMRPWEIPSVPGVPLKVKPPERERTDEDLARIASTGSPWLSLKA